MVSLAMPVISIAAGPSLRQHIDTLRALQDKCLFVACDAVLKGLVAEGIQPHFCTPLERVDEVFELTEPAIGTRTIFAGIRLSPANRSNHSKAAASAFGDATISMPGWIPAIPIRS